MDPWLKLFLHMNRVLRRCLKADSPNWELHSKLTAREVYLWVTLTAFEEWKSLSNEGDREPATDSMFRFLVLAEEFRGEAEARIAMVFKPQLGRCRKALLQ